MNTKHIPSHSMGHLLNDTYGIQLNSVEARRQADALKGILLRHRQSFSHFITVHPLRAIDLGDLGAAQDLVMEAVQGLHKNRSARFVHFISLSQPFRRTVKQTFEFAHWRKQLIKEWSYSAEDQPLIGGWHLHSLVGSVNPEQKPRDIEKSFRSLGHRGSGRLPWGDICVVPYDQDSSLIEYLTDAESWRGNHIPRLQSTNDTYVRNQCEKQHIEMNWRPPHNPRRAA